MGKEKQVLKELWKCEIQQQVFVLLQFGWRCWKETMNILYAEPTPLDVSPAQKP